MHETAPRLDDTNITRLSQAELGENLEDTLKRVAGELRRVVVHHQGKDIAVLVPLEDLALIEEMEDRFDLENAEAAMAEDGKNIKLADLKAELGL
jgi:PHD/YefM family antitoxin component YafN of YafNO toxin-antitoxin module